MSTYSEAAADVLAELSDPDVGVALTFTHKAFSSETAGAPTFTTPTTTVGRCLVCDPIDGKNFGSAWGKSYADAALTTTQKRFLWVAASGMTFAPGPSDTVSLEGITWKVLGRYKLSLDGATDILYGLGVEQQ